MNKEQHEELHVLAKEVHDVRAGSRTSDYTDEILESDLYHYYCSIEGNDDIEHEVPSDEQMARLMTRLRAIVKRNLTRRET